MAEASRAAWWECLRERQWEKMESKRQCEGWLKIRLRDVTASEGLLEMEAFGAEVKKTKWQR